MTNETYDEPVTLDHREPKHFHMADQPPLPMSHGGKRLGKLLVAPAQVRPIRQFMDIRHNHRSLRGDYCWHSPHAFW